VSKTPISSKIDKILIPMTGKLLPTKIPDSKTNSKDQLGNSLVHLVHKIPVGIGLPRGCTTEILKSSKNEIYNTEQHGEHQIDGSKTSVDCSEISMTRKTQN